MEGAAGAAATFHFAYAGGEPLPGRHTPLPGLRTATPEPSTDPLAVERAFAAAHLTPASANASAIGAGPGFSGFAAPAYSGEMRRIGGDAAFRAGNLPAGGAETRDIRPEYQGSGNWIGQPE